MCHFIFFISQLRTGANKIHSYFPLKTIKKEKLVLQHFIVWHDQYTLKLYPIQI
jgi:hypothetical protein